MDLRIKLGNRTKRMPTEVKLKRGARLCSDPDSVTADSVLKISIKIIFCWRGNRKPSRSFPKTSGNDF